ncbi:MAG: hypothetical protein R6U46_06730 [Marinilabilia sp.]
MKRTALLFIVFLSIFIEINAYSKKDLLQSKTNPEDLKTHLVDREKWIPFPAYEDRKAWEELTDPVRDKIIKKGEQALNHHWTAVKATDYLAFDRNGDRNIMQNPFSANNRALANLVMAELTEGKGRFMDQIANGIWHTCEMTSWALSAHVARDQSVNTSLPVPGEHIIDLTAGDVGSLLAWTHHLLKDETAIKTHISNKNITS